MEKNIKTSVSLKACPFCGNTAEIHARQAPVSLYESEAAVPVGAIIVSVSENGLVKAKRFVYVPRCSDTQCVGRNARPFDTVEAAAEQWNIRKEG